MKKIHWKYYIALFIFQTIMFGALFFIMKYGKSEGSTLKMEYLAIFGWIICTSYILINSSFKKES